MRQSLIFRIVYLSFCMTFMISMVIELLLQNKLIQDEHSLIPIVDDVVVLAHRGASEYGPENTLAAFKRALRMHVDYIELDVQKTKDGHLIVVHDKSLKRTTNAKKIFPQRSPWLVKDFNLDEIRHLDAGSWFNKAYKNKARQGYKQQHISTLGEVIQFMKRKGDEKAGLCIDIKAEQGIEKPLVNILREKGVLYKKNLIIQSQSESSLRKFKKLAPDVKVVQLYSRHTLEGMDLKQELKRISKYAYGIGPDKKMVIPQLIRIAHQNGLLVHPWTINEQNDMSAVLSLGVDGVITNKPDRFNFSLDMIKCSKDPKCN